MDELLTTWIGLLEPAVALFSCIVVSLTLLFGVAVLVFIAVGLVKELMKSLY